MQYVGLIPVIYIHLYSIHVAHVLYTYVLYTYVHVYCTLSLSSSEHWCVKVSSEWLSTYQCTCTCILHLYMHHLVPISTCTRTCTCFAGVVNSFPCDYLSYVVCPVDGVYMETMYVAH